jgi:hypothetical protein
MDSMIDMRHPLAVLATPAPWRQAIEPAIGHAKLDHRMERCWLQGSMGDALHAVLCACQRPA